ncbi:Dps family protein [Celeribacter litoreus]|uniref:Dps family protein n=1 Tax=Celeribacter litoreus TaxID=2876714 RepID=UPI001CCD8E96|nr:DNA starvation/stationary phase protection protein [Celeribacter litoreus]MCA0042243.1 DNA starvation/stationary phase protection protein [Celeribacter litoreus]
MAHALKMLSDTEPHSVADESVQNVASGLEKVLSDTYSLLIKTHVYHWNVTGPLFHSLHTLTEEQYQDLFAATDTLAERIRALGHLAPNAFKDVVESKAIGEPSNKPSAAEMIEELATDHDRIARRLVALTKISEEANDPVSADLATTRAAFHQKASWMLRSMIQS